MTFYGLNGEMESLPFEGTEMRIFFLHHLILGCTLAGAGVHLQFWLTATKSIEFAHVLH